MGKKLSRLSSTASRHLIFSLGWFHFSLPLNPFRMGWFHFSLPLSTLQTLSNCPSNPDMLETVCLTGQLGDGIAHWVEEILFVLGLPLLVIAPRQHIDDVLGS